MFTWFKKLFFENPSRVINQGVDKTVDPMPVFDMPKTWVIPEYNRTSAVNMYRTNPILSGCINLNAKTIATIPLRLFAWSKGQEMSELRKKTARGVIIRPLSKESRRFLEGEEEIKPSQYIRKKYVDFNGEFVEIENDASEGGHRLLNLLSSGCKEYDEDNSSGLEQTVARLVELQLLGEYYLQLIYDEMNLPKEMWVVPGQYMTIEPYKTGENLEKRYHWGPTSDKTILTPDEIIHAKQYNPSDLYYGLSPVEACWGALNWLQSWMNYGVAMMDNMGVPTIIAQIDKATEVTLNRFEKKYNKHCAGVQNAGRMLAINDQVVLSSPPNNSGDLIGKISPIYLDRITEVCFTLGVPISKVKSNDSNLASAFITDRAWYRDNLAHICRFDETILNEELLPKFELDDCFLAYTGVIPKDDEAIEKRLIALNAAGIVNKEYVRMKLAIDEEFAPEEVNITDKVTTSSGDQPAKVSTSTSTQDTENGERQPKGSGEAYEK